MAGLLSEPRRRRILEWIEEEGSARVRDLAAAFEVSEATIRQDLAQLENDGHITREHGGAFLNSMRAQVHGFSLHHQVHMEAKRKIGALAAAQVADGETITFGEMDPERKHAMSHRADAFHKLRAALLP